MADIPVLAAAEEPASSGGGGKGKWITIIIAVVLVVAGAGAGAFLGPFFHSSPTAASNQKATNKPAKEVVKGPPLYAALDPPFVVNFEADQAVRFLQITVQAMSRDQHTLDLLKANDPVVRNDLLLLFGNQKYTTISTSAGKEKLRADALDAVRKVTAGAGGKPELVEAVYFTSFVMQ
jgi:flagellar protein FliL